MLGVGAALMLELTQRRIRSAEDLAQLIELPVLAQLDSTQPASSKGWRFWAKNTVDRSSPSAPKTLSPSGA